MQEKTVILIEPQDSNMLSSSRFKVRTLPNWSVQVFKNYIKSKMEKDIYCNIGNYEQPDNYVFSISGHEMEKVR